MVQLYQQKKQNNIMGHKGHYGEYTGNAKWSKNHADTKVTKSNYKASERDDAAHIDYLKRDIDYDNKHGHSDSSMTSDEKHISKLAGDMKYDKEHHGSAAKMVSPLNDKSGKESLGGHNMTQKTYDKHVATDHARYKDTQDRVEENLKKNPDHYKNKKTNKKNN